MNLKINSRYFRLLIASLFVISLSYDFCLYAGISSTLPDEEVNLLIVDTSAVTLTNSNTSIPILIDIAKNSRDSIFVSVLHTKSENGENILIDYKVWKDTLKITAHNNFVLFNIYPDSVITSDLSAGHYILTLLVQYGTEKQKIEKISFIIPATTSIFTYFEFGVIWIKDHLLLLVWYIVEIGIFVLIILILIQLLRVVPLIGRKRSLQVLPIVNETGNDKKFKGVASGIDDILMSKMQEIAELSRSDEVIEYKRSKTTDKKELSEERKSTKEDKTEKLESLDVLGVEDPNVGNVIGGNISLDFQKLGDISVGPIKIPLGAISSLLLKLVGGYYISGALQQYGSKNKLVLSLENRYSLFRFKKSQAMTRYFEATWPSKELKEEQLAEGIPTVIEELAYRIIVDLSEGVGTYDWRAYKYLLEGKSFFNKYERNRTRRDLLIDATNSWRKSVSFDPDFAKAHFNLGLALHLDGLALNMEEKYEDAIFRYQKAIQLSPDKESIKAHYN
ncbi:MAG: tetratricopeptide repeat protein, partial [Promethearchaeota archaeon]